MAFIPFLGVYGINKLRANSFKLNLVDSGSRHRISDPNRPLMLDQSGI
ncbi:hypothetical protein [Lyngbya aestuarii]